MPEQTRAGTSHGIDLRAIAWVTAALCGTVLLAAGGAYLAWRGASATPRLLAPNAPAALRVAGVPLESAPRSGRADYAASKQRLLQAHEWLGGDETFARIPIDAAMRMLIQRDAARRAAAGTAGPPP